MGDIAFLVKADFLDCVFTADSLPAAIEKVQQLQEEHQPKSALWKIFVTEIVESKEIVRYLVVATEVSDRIFEWTHKSDLDKYSVFLISNKFGSGDFLFEVEECPTTLDGNPSRDIGHFILDGRPYSYYYSDEDFDPRKIDPLTSDVMVRSFANLEAQLEVLWHLRRTQTDYLLKGISSFVEDMNDIDNLLRFIEDPTHRLNPNVEMSYDDSAEYFMFYFRIDRTIDNPIINLHLRPLSQKRIFENESIHFTQLYVGHSLVINKNTIVKHTPEELIAIDDTSGFRSYLVNQKIIVSREFFDKNSPKVFLSEFLWPLIHEFLISFVARLQQEKSVLEADWSYAYVKQNYIQNV